MREITSAINLYIQVRISIKPNSAYYKTGTVYV